MTWKRLLLAAAAGSALSTMLAPAKADTVTAVVSQDQANRLSLFHDYGLNAVGNDNYVGVPVNVANPNDLGGQVPGAPGTGLISGYLPSSAVSTDTTSNGRPFDFTLTPLVGYDANPEAHRVPRGGAFAGGEFGAAYHVADGADDPIVGQPLRATFAYSALGAFYEGQVQNADTLQQNLSASVRQTLFGGTIVMSSTLVDSFTMEHGSAFLDTFDAGATGEFFFLPQASIETGYDFTHFQYFFTATNENQKPTADRNTFIAKAHLYTLPQRLGATIEEAPDLLTEILRAAIRRVTVNYAHVWNQPTEHTGNDYEYQANRIGLGLEGLTVPSTVGNRSLGTFGQSLSFDVDYDHEFQNFDNSNSVHEQIVGGHLTPRGGPHRKDGIDIFTLRGNARLFDLPRDAGTLATYLQWDLIHDGSNIIPRRYNSYIISGGLTYRY